MGRKGAIGSMYYGNGNSHASAIRPQTPGSRARSPIWDLTVESRDSSGTPSPHALSPPPPHRTFSGEPLPHFQREPQARHDKPRWLLTENAGHITACGNIHEVHEIMHGAHLGAAVVVATIASENRGSVYVLFCRPPSPGDIFALETINEDGASLR